jgi:succinyl-diaminopimelate desuccinylase
VVEFGLVGSTVHMVDEHIAIADLVGLTEINAAILEDYFNKE